MELINLIAIAAYSILFLYVTYTDFKEKRIGLWPQIGFVAITLLTALISVNQWIFILILLYYFIIVSVLYLLPDSFEKYIGGADLKVILAVAPFFLDHALSFIINVLILLLVAMGIQWIMDKCNKTKREFPAIFVVFIAFLYTAIFARTIILG